MDKIFTKVNKELKRSIKIIWRIDKIKWDRGLFIF